jgi:ETS translocation variant 6/7
MIPFSKGGWSIADLHYAAAQQNGTTSVTLSPAPSLDGQAGSPQEHGSTNGINRLSSSASSSSTGNHSDDSEYDSVGDSPERSPTNQSLSPPPLPQPQQLTNSVVNANVNSNGDRSSHNGGQHSNKSSSPSSLSHGASKLTSSSNEGGEYNNNGRLLWDFLQQLLNDPAQRYNSFIAWKNVETGIFKIVDPPGLARLWGIQKNHLSMNYDKMSRALRYYYRVNILRKVQGERHCYQFLRNPGELKSIKNISMLRHQQSSPVSLSVKSEPMAFMDNEYVDDDMPTDLSMDSERHLKEELD